MHAAPSPFTIDLPRLSVVGAPVHSPPAKRSSRHGLSHVAFHPTRSGLPRPIQSHESRRASSHRRLATSGVRRSSHQSQTFIGPRHVTWSPLPPFEFVRSLTLCFAVRSVGLRRVHTVMSSCFTIR